MYLESVGVKGGASWMAWYAHGFSSEQCEPDPADDDVWDDVVLVVSEAVAVGGMWVFCGGGGVGGLGGLWGWLGWCGGSWWGRWVGGGVSSSLLSAR